MKKLQFDTNNKNKSQILADNRALRNEIFGCYCFCFNVLISMLLLSKMTTTFARSSSFEMLQTWPPLPHHDIWDELPKTENNDATVNTLNNAELPATAVGVDIDMDESFFAVPTTKKDNVENVWQNDSDVDVDGKYYRHGKVLHIFPVPVDGECLSDDGRRTGTCFNAYECRQKGGQAKGDCAMGFGVCCIFIANCNETISNNITYLVSPNFPSFMTENFTDCRIKVKMMGDEISQLRFDFQHFSLGQPNRRSGVCDGDIFTVSGGLGGAFKVCGQNSGQHIYYDVGGRSLPRQAIYGSLRPLTLEQIYPNLNVSNTEAQGDRLIEITMNFSQRFLPIRLWEIRILQIPFSQRAPAGCLQYHTGTDGVIQTFNFAENGRHLANQNYRICMRQETDMCSIIYQPCDEQSFRIGPSGAGAATMNMGAMMGIGMAGMPMQPTQGSTNTMTATSESTTTIQMTRLSTTTSQADAISSTTESTTSTTSSSTLSDDTTTTVAATTSTTTTTMAPATEDSTTAAPAMDQASESTTAAPTTTTTSTSTPLSDDVEGSGDEDNVISPPNRPSRRPRPVSGGFDLLGFIRNAFDFGFRRRRRHLSRQPRQFFTTCNDRITMPCIVEDFIGTGFGALPGCEPVHCGAQFCASGVWPCRIESTVTPFYIGIRFGDGASKGSAEDNIGACLRYNQVQCM